MAKRKRLFVPKFDDMHVHLREDVWTMAITLGSLKGSCKRIMAMLNTKELVVRSLGKLNEYASMVNQACRTAKVPDDFEVYLCPKIYQDCDEPTPLEFADEAARWKGSGFVKGVIAFKAYPAGQTTNSDGGISDFGNSWFKDFACALAGNSLILSVHSELPGPDKLECEANFFKETAHQILDIHPDSQIVFEHISTKVGVEFIKNNLACCGTITPHHIALNTDDVLGPDGKVIDPHNLCMPILKSEEDRKAIHDAVFHPSFFYGSDTAPHTKGAKLKQIPPCGIFSAPMAPLVFGHMLYAANASQREQIVDFLSRRGEAFYGLKPREKSKELRLVEEDTSIGKTISMGNIEICEPQYSSICTLEEKT